MPESVLQGALDRVVRLSRWQREDQPARTDRAIVGAYGGGGHGRPMLFRVGTSPAAMIRSASGRIASTRSLDRSPSVATRGAASRSVWASMAARASAPDGV